MSESDKTVDIIVPDIGDSQDVEVIEILISVGDAVNVDDSLLTLESDKASMEIPATQSGVVDSLSVSIGDTVNVGDVIGKMSLIGAAAPAEVEEPAAEAPTPKPEVEDVKPATPPKEPAAPAPSPAQNLRVVFSKPMSWLSSNKPWKECNPTTVQAVQRVVQEFHRYLR